LLLAAAALVVAGCGRMPAASPGSETTSGDPGSWEFPSCDDLPDLAAPPEAYRDEPIYVADEAPVDEVKAWAKSQPGYEEIWIDWDRHGWISVAFSQDAEARQRDLEEEFAGVGVVAVPVERTKAELEALAFRVQRELARFLIKHDAIGVGGSVAWGVAYLEVGVLTEELRREIARRFSGAPLCVDGRDPATVPAPGPQPSGGDGWLLLADEGSGGDNWRVGLATDAAGLAKEWAELGLAAPLPEVDFGEHVVVSFGTSHGSSCPDIRLDDVVVDGAVVYPEIVNLTTNLICTDDYYPYTYVVALERSRLPSGPFVIQSEAKLWSNSKPEERLIVDVDLSAPGAVAGPDEARHDAGLPEPTPPEQWDIWPDDPWPHLLDARCGIEWLGKVDGYAWRTDEPMPEEWGGSLDADGALNVTATLRVDPETVIEAELGGKTVVYKPTVEEMAECDQP